MWGFGMWTPRKEMKMGFMFMIHIQLLFPGSRSTHCLLQSYDGLIRLMDVQKETFNMVYSSDHLIYSICQPPDNVSSIYFGEAAGDLKLWDERTGKISSAWYLQEQRINTIDFNPVNINMIATSSTDGTACIWDLRKLKTHQPESLKTVQHKRPVHSAYFSPGGIHLATTSIDDKVGILSVVNFDNLSMIRHVSLTGRWLSSFRPDLKMRAWWLESHRSPPVTVARGNTIEIPRETKIWSRRARLEELWFFDQDMAADVSLDRIPNFTLPNKDMSSKKANCIQGNITRLPKTRKFYKNSTMLKNQIRPDPYWVGILPADSTHIAGAVYIKPKACVYSFSGKTESEAAASLNRRPCWASSLPALIEECTKNNKADERQEADLAERSPFRRAFLAVPIEKIAGECSFGPRSQTHIADVANR
ncbi:WD repeat-containing protein 76 [Canna indica]|uniref:WD repeat-containing protein 76 n=1 Tax=Canna indica TaxID=4628 RepID=A0AAQ3KF85_9LILI|nr:WD repeat-containing protein 76 [Canna indica]